MYENKDLSKVRGRGSNGFGDTNINHNLQSGGYRPRQDSTGLPSPRGSPYSGVSEAGSGDVYRSVPPKNMMGGSPRVVPQGERRLEHPAIYSRPPLPLPHQRQDSLPQYSPSKQGAYQGPPYDHSQGIAYNGNYRQDKQQSVISQNPLPSPVCEGYPGGRGRPDGHIGDEYRSSQTVSSPLTRRAFQNQGSAPNSPNYSMSNPNKILSTQDGYLGPRVPVRPAEETYNPGSPPVPGQSPRHRRPPGEPQYWPAGNLNRTSSPRGSSRRSSPQGSISKVTGPPSPIGNGHRLTNPPNPFSGNLTYHPASPKGPVPRFKSPNSLQDQGSQFRQAYSPMSFARRPASPAASQNSSNSSLQHGTQASGSPVDSLSKRLYNQQVDSGSSEEHVPPYQRPAVPTILEYSYHNVLASSPGHPRSPQGSPVNPSSPSESHYPDAQGVQNTSLGSPNMVYIHEGNFPRAPSHPDILQCGHNQVPGQASLNGPGIYGRTTSLSSLSRKEGSVSASHSDLRDGRYSKSPDQLDIEDRQYSRALSQSDLYLQPQHPEHHEQHSRAGSTLQDGLSGVGPVYRKQQKHPAYHDELLTEGKYQRAPTYLSLNEGQPSKGSSCHSSNEAYSRAPSHPNLNEGHHSRAPSHLSLNEGHHSRAPSHLSLNEGYHSRAPSHLSLNEEQYSRAPSNPNINEEQYSRAPSHPNLNEGQYSRAPSHPNLNEGQYSRAPNHPNLNEGQYSTAPNQPSLNEGQYSRAPSHPNLNEGQYSRAPSHPSLYEGQHSRAPSHPNINEAQYSRAPSHPNINEAQYSSATSHPSLNEGQYSRASSHPVDREGQCSRASSQSNLSNLIRGQSHPSLPSGGTTYYNEHKINSSDGENRNEDLQRALYHPSVQSAPQRAASSSNILVNDGDVKRTVAPADDKPNNLDKAETRNEPDQGASSILDAEGKYDTRCSVSPNPRVVDSSLGLPASPRPPLSQHPEKAPPVPHLPAAVSCSSLLQAQQKPLVPPPYSYQAKQRQRQPALLSYPTSQTECAAPSRQTAAAAPVARHSTSLARQSASHQPEQRSAAAARYNRHYYYDTNRYVIMALVFSAADVYLEGIFSSRQHQCQPPAYRVGGFILLPVEAAGADDRCRGLIPVRGIHIAYTIQRGHQKTSECTRSNTCVNCMLWY